MWVKLKKIKTEHIFEFCSVLDITSAILLTNSF